MPSERPFSEFPGFGWCQIQIGQNLLDNEIPVPLRTKAFELRLEAMWQGQKVVSFTGSGRIWNCLEPFSCGMEFRP